MADELGEGDIQFGRLILGGNPTDIWHHSLCLLQGAGVSPAHPRTPFPAQGSKVPFPKARPGLTHVSGHWL